MASFLYGRFNSKPSVTADEEKEVNRQAEIARNLWRQHKILPPSSPMRNRWNMLLLFLVIYVDDFKLSGPADNLPKGWDLIAKGLNIDKPKDVNGQTYLGCQQERWEVDLPGGGKATVDCKNMQPYMESCVQLYRDLAPGVTLNHKRDRLARRHSADDGS